MTTTSARMMTLRSHCGGAWRKKLHLAHTYHCGTRVKLNGMKSSARDRSYPAVSAREVGLLQGRTLQRVRSVLPEGSGYDDIHMRAARKAQKTPWRPPCEPYVNRGRARPREGGSTHSATHAGSQGEARVGAKGANIVAVVAPLATWRNGAPFATWRNGAPALRRGRAAPSESGIDAERDPKERGRTAEPAQRMRRANSIEAPATLPPLWRAGAAPSMRVGRQAAQKSVARYCSRGLAHGVQVHRAATTRPGRSRTH